MVVAATAGHAAKCATAAKPLLVVPPPIYYASALALHMCKHTQRCTTLLHAHISLNSVGSATICCMALPHASPLPTALRFYAAATQKFKLAQTGSGIALASTFNSLREYFSPATDFYTTF